MQVMNTLDSFIGLLSVEGIVIEMNAAALAAMGLDREDVVGRPFSDMLFWNWSEALQSEVRSDVVMAAQGRVQRSDRTLRLSETRYVHFECCLKPAVNDSGCVTHVVWSATDITARVRQLERANTALSREIEERRRAEALVLAGEERLRRKLEELETIYREAPVGLCLIDRDLRFRRINMRLAEINGKPVEAHIGRSVAEIVPDLADTALPMLRQVFESGEPLQNVEIQGETPKSPGVTRFWVEDLYPLKNETGEVWAVGIMVRDVTERRSAEAQREMLLAELEHRVKNTLAAVMSIAVHTLNDGKMLDVAREAFLGRLQALSHAHDLLAECNWRGADLAQVVRGTLKPYVGMEKSRGTVNGPPIFLQPRAALTLGMIIHELATNAAKYGCLSAPGGSLDVTWSSETLCGEARVKLIWSERGGPSVLPPTRSGFGRTLIERGLKHDLGGSAQLEFRVEGLMCTLSLPLQYTAHDLS